MIGWLRRRAEQREIERVSKEIKRAAYNQTLEVMARIGRRHAPSMAPYEAWLFQELICSLYRMNPHNKEQGQ